MTENEIINQGARREEPLTPELEACNKTERAFIEALGNMIKQDVRLAYMQARGIHDRSPNEHSIQVMASRMLRSNRVQAALAANSRRDMTGLAAVAVRVLEQVLENPQHKDQAKMAANVLDRVLGSPTQRQEITLDQRSVNVNMDITDPSMTPRVRALAQLFNMDGAKLQSLLGDELAKRAQRPSVENPDRAIVIDVECEEIPNFLEGLE